MEEQLLEQIKALFQEAYSIIYKDGKFDAMADQAEADGNPVAAVSQLVGSIVNSVIKDAGITDLNVLFGLAIMLIGDLLEALQEVGIVAEDGSMEAIISNTMQIVLGENPSIAQAVQNEPAIQEAMQSMGGAEGVQDAVQQEAAQGNQMAQGIQEGAENTQGVM